MSPGINTGGNIPEQIAEENYIVNALRTGRKHVLDIYTRRSRRAGGGRGNVIVARAVHGGRAADC